MGECGTGQADCEIAERTYWYVSRFHMLLDEVARRLGRAQLHLESPQERQVMHPSIMMTATVLHLVHS